MEEISLLHSPTDANKNKVNLDNKPKTVFNVKVQYTNVYIRQFSNFPHFIANNPLLKNHKNKLKILLKLYFLK